jgi:DNA-binding CsgD family transcriptional regulator
MHATILARRDKPKKMELTAHGRSSEANLSHLIELIYGAVSDRGRWPVFLEALVEVTQCRRGALLLSGAPEWSATCFHGWTEQDIATWVGQYVKADLWGMAASKAPLGRVWTSLELCPQEAFEQSVAYREFYGPRNCVFGVGGAFLRTQYGDSAFSLVRERELGPCGDREKSILQPLMPHLHRAALLHSELGSMRAQLSTFTSHMNRSPHAFCLVDRGGLVLYANAAAEQIANRSNGVTIEAGRMTLPYPRRQSELLEAIRRVAGTNGASFSHLKTGTASRKTPYRLLVFSVPDSGVLPFGVSQPSAAVLILDSESEFTADPTVLKELYSLTPTESRITGQLVLGRSIEDIAGEMNASVQTVRTHVKRILSKTSTTRQGELISLVLRTLPFRNA